MRYPLDCSVAIPTYYPGKIIENLLKSLPSVKEVFILDNGKDEDLKNLIKNKYKDFNHIELGDVGLGKTFNKFLQLATSQNLFITQPDVILEKYCIENLIDAKSIYPDACVLSPVYYEKEVYSMYDFLDLKLNRFYEIENDKRKKIKKIEPWGDFCVEAVASTSNLLIADKIKEIGGWDDYFYTYLEDVDLSLRIRQKKSSIIKIYSSRINHIGFGSHSEDIQETMNEKEFLILANLLCILI